MIDRKEILLPDVGSVLFTRKAGVKNFIIRVHLNGQVRVVFPRHVSFSLAENQLQTRKAWVVKRLTRMRERTEKWKKNISALPEVSAARAKEVILSRLRELAAAHGFSFSSVRFASQRTVWGSCAGKERLSLNLRLARLPRELMDYVLLHELTHTRVADHSTLFWQEIHKYVPDARRLDRELNEYPLELLIKREA